MVFVFLYLTSLGMIISIPSMLDGRAAGCSPWGRLESDTTQRLHFHFSLSTHSSVLAWRIPGMVGPGGLHLWDCTELDTTEAI